MKKLIISIILVLLITFLFKELVIPFNNNSKENHIKLAKLEEESKDTLNKLENKENMKNGNEVEKEFIRKENEKQDKLKKDKEEFLEKFEYSYEKYGDELSLNENQNIPILIFHEIRKDYNGNVQVIITDETLKEYLLYLKALKYQAITFKDYLEFKEGKKKIAKNSVLITFDDGYKSNYKIAYPMLKDLGMKATISIIGKYIDEAKEEDWEKKSLSFLTWDNIKEMMDNGVIDIGDHTYNLHIDGDGISEIRGVLGLKNDSELRIEGRIAEDELLFKQKVKNYLKYKPIVFTYPMGLQNSLVDSLYKNSGYNFRLGTEHGISNINSDLPLKRINTPLSTQAIKVIKEMLRLRGQETTLPFEEMQDQKERIKKLEELVRGQENQ